METAWGRSGGRLELLWPHPRKIPLIWSKVSTQMQLGFVNSATCLSRRSMSSFLAVNKMVVCRIFMMFFHAAAY